VCCRNVQLMPTLFLKLTKIWQRENSKFVDFNDPTQVWRRPSKKRLRISTNDRPTRGTIPSYNIAGLISEVSEEVATQIAKNMPSSTTHSHLKSPPRGTPTSIRN